jgi:tRNA threonylcarbamoyladenosine biosynthesis protein TsaB
MDRDSGQGADGFDEEQGRPLLGPARLPLGPTGLLLGPGRLLLGIDTCGPTGSVALARLNGDSAQILEQIRLEGRSYSATLVAAVGDLLARAGARVADVGAIVAVNGPGSFTGVRVGLSAVKGLAEVDRTPVVAVSRLEVLAWKAGLASSALDAHRQEVFLRLGEPSRAARELLAGAAELAGICPVGEPGGGALVAGKVAICDEAATSLLGSAWPSVQLVRVDAPTAADALGLCAPRVAAGYFVDLALFDGNYLRRSDAEIFGEASLAQASEASRP